MDPTPTAQLSTALPTVPGSKVSGATEKDIDVCTRGPSQPAV